MCCLKFLYVLMIFSMIMSIYGWCNTVTVLAKQDVNASTKKHGILKNYYYIIIIINHKQLLCRHCKLRYVTVESCS